MLNKLKIISRNSALAMWQANHVKELLMANYPQLEVEIIGITTAGDRILDKSLDKIGGKGLFIKELEQQLLDGRADIAVHSLKDLPANLPAGFTLAAVLVGWCLLLERDLLGEKLLFGPNNRSLLCLIRLLPVQLCCYLLVCIFIIHLTLIKRKMF